MLFNSFLFWLVFPVIFAIYWLIPNSLLAVRRFYLILASYLLYLNWNPAYALLLAGITLITWWGGRQFGNSGNRRKNLLILVVLFTLLPLFVFKYYNFLITSVNELLSAVGLRFELTGLNWAIPMGISFFTFQSLSYVWDVWYGKTKPVKSLVEYALFICFFPQITSGPISKANELIPQIRKLRSFDYARAVQGLRHILWGTFLKVVVADRLGIFVDTVYANWFHYGGLANFWASVFYTIQIYADFAGYSLLAIGIARLLGFELINNFQRPYFSVSITDFWRRWHISLSRWLRDYVFIPLGGSRCSKFRIYLNIFVTFLVSGIWHGANWTFILWGIFHGLFQIIEKHLGFGKSNAVGVKRLCRIVLTFVLVNLTWILFRLPTVSDALGVIGKIVMFESGTMAKFSNTNMVCYAMGIGLLLFKEIREEFFPDSIRWLNTKWGKWLTYVILMVLILTIGALDSGSFIYVNF